MSTEKSELVLENQSHGSVVSVMDRSSVRDEPHCSEQEENDVVEVALRNICDYANVLPEYENEIKQQINAALDAERQDRDEARAQREWLIKECARVGVTVNVQIGAPITEAYRLVNTERQRREQAERSLLAESVNIESILSDQERLEQQLLSAQAAIDRIRGAIRGSYWQNKPLIEALTIANNVDVDFSLLHQHDKKTEAAMKDKFRPTIKRIHGIAQAFGWQGGETQSALDYIAEVRKPLVDGIYRLFALIDAKHYEQGKQIRDAALAQMNEKI